jgi:CheY-like chemotaxis protein
MALGALIGAYQEDDSGNLRALYPLAGRTLLEYQVRCAAAAGASPIVVLVERLPIDLNLAIERLRGEGISVVAVSDGNEAASRFEAGSLILVVADGFAPDFGLLTRLSEHAEPAVALVPDDEAHARHERVDAMSRWAGAALVDAHLLGSTAAMLGDWDLQSTLLRRAVQDGAVRVPAGEPGNGGILSHQPDDLAHFERRLVVATRGARSDWASRYLLPMIEEFGTEKLMESQIKPVALVGFALGLTVAAAFGFTRGWIWQSYLLLVLATPLDLIAARLAALRLRPLAPGLWVRRLLWPGAGLALLALGWWSHQHGGGWGSSLAALTAAAFAQAARNERSGSEMPNTHWLFSRRNAIVAAAPFIAFGWLEALLVGLLLYAGSSFFLAQHWRHRIIRD